jgi:hypothetical protein
VVRPGYGPIRQAAGRGHNAEIAKIVAVSPDGVLGRAALLGIDFQPAAD